MVKYRDRLDIVADVLIAVGKGAKKTKIMYLANLSYSLLEKYLDETVGSGLIFFNHETYEMTEKGRTFIEMYGEFSSKRSKIVSELERVTFEKEVLEKMCRCPLPVSSSSRPRR